MEREELIHPCTIGHTQLSCRITTASTAKESSNTHTQLQKKHTNKKRLHQDNIIHSNYLIKFFFREVAIKLVW